MHYFQSITIFRMKNFKIHLEFPILLIRNLKHQELITLISEIEEYIEVNDYSTSVKFLSFLRCGFHFESKISVIKCCDILGGVNQTHSITVTNFYESPYYIYFTCTYILLLLPLRMKGRIKFERNEPDWHQSTEKTSRKNYRASHGGAHL